MVTDSEQYVFDVCQKTFLSLWSYPNPQGKKGKELCDILVVCGEDIIIISVKDIAPSDTGDLKVNWNRWTKRAIDSSVKQIYGAERWLKSATCVIEHDGTKGLPLPPKDKRRIHRVAVAFGGQDKVPIYYGDFGKGYVHVLDEKGFDILLSELDTISDFLGYLTTKETYFLSGGQAAFEGHEEDLLAFYLYHGRCFPEEYTMLVIGDDLWETVREKPEYKAKKREDKVSYIWDGLIETHIHGILQGHAYINPGILAAEPAIREMALEDRYWRRALSKAWLEFIDLAKAKKLRSRYALSPERKTAYVFLPARPDDDPKARMGELAARCWVVRDKARDYKTVIGIAAEEFRPDHPLDLFYLYKPEWTEEDEKKAAEAREDLGLFRNPVQKNVKEDEYPST